MPNISNHLQCTTIANMIATELKRKNIPLAEDENARDSILYSAAINILYEGGIDKDIQLCVDRIKEYISNTLINYPSYFMTGQNK